MSAADAATGISAAAMAPAIAARFPQVRSQVRLCCQSPCSPDIGLGLACRVPPCKAHFGPIPAERSGVLSFGHTSDFAREQPVTLAFPADAAAQEASREYRE